MRPAPGGRPGMPIRLISHSSVTPHAACTRRRTSSPRPSRSAAVRRPVLSRKLQCFSLTCAPPRTKPRQPAASISSHAFWPGGLRNVLPPVRARTGWVASRLARISAMRAAIAAGSPGRARNRARTTTAPGGRPRGGSRMPARRPAAAPVAGAGDELRPVQAAGDVAAIGAGVHRHRAADRAGDAGQELEPGQPGRRRVLGHRRVQRRGARDHAVRLHRDVAEAARQPHHHARARRRRAR